MVIALIIILIAALWIFLSSLAAQIIPKMTTNLSEPDQECALILGVIFSPISMLLIGFYTLGLLCTKQTKGIADRFNNIIDKDK